MIDGSKTIIIKFKLKKKKLTLGSITGCPLSSCVSCCVIMYCVFKFEYYMPCSIDCNYSLK